MFSRVRPVNPKASPSGLEWLKFFQFGNQFGIVGHYPGFEEFDPPENALFVYNENRAVGATQLFVEHAVLFRRLAVRPKVGDERIRNAAQRFAPRLFGKDRITADSQDLAVRSIELGALRFVRRNLFVSRRGKSERMKCNHDILAPAIVA